VRYIGNRSSGKMGYAIAEAALRRGARVILVTAHESQAPSAAEVVNVQPRRKCADAVLARASEASIISKPLPSAIIARRAPPTEDQAPSGALLALELEGTTDILAELGKRKSGKTDLIGFAAETENVLENARKKLLTKSLDAIVVNDVSQPGIGFDSERNAVTIITRHDVIDVPNPPSGRRQRVIETAIKLRSQARSPKIIPSAGA